MRMLLLYIPSNYFARDDIKLESRSSFADDYETIKKTRVNQRLVLPVHHPSALNHSEDLRDLSIFRASATFGFDLELEHFLGPRIRHQYIDSLRTTQGHVRVVTLQYQLREHRKLSSQRD